MQMNRRGLLFQGLAALSLATPVTRVLAQNTKPAVAEDSLFIGQTSRQILIFDPRKLEVGMGLPPHHYDYKGLVKGYDSFDIAEDSAAPIYVSAVSVMALFRNDANCEFFYCGMIDLLNSKHPQAMKALRAIDYIAKEIVRNPTAIEQLPDGEVLRESCRPIKTSSITSSYRAIVS